MKKPWYPQFGSNLRQAMAACDLSIRETARRVAVSHVYLVQIVNGQRRCSEAVLADLAHVLGEEVDTLQGPRGDPPTTLEEALHTHQQALHALARRVVGAHACRRRVVLSLAEVAALEALLKAVGVIDA